MFTIDRTIEIAAPLDRVHTAVTTEVGYHAWLAVDADFDGEHATFRFAQPNEIRSVTFRVDRRDTSGIVMTCTSHENNADWLGTTLAIELAETPTGTRVHLVHAGYAAKNEVYERCRGAWRTGSRAASGSGGSRCRTTRGRSERRRRARCSLRRTKRRACAGRRRRVRRARPRARRRARARRPRPAAPGARVSGASPRLVHPGATPASTPRRESHTGCARRGQARSPAESMDGSRRTSSSGDPRRHRWPRAAPPARRAHRRARSTSRAGGRR